MICPLQGLLVITIVLFRIRVHLLPWERFPFLHNIVRYLYFLVSLLFAGKHLFTYCLSLLHTYYIEAATRRFLWKEGVLKNFTKFTGKHLWQSLFFNKVAGLRLATFLKKRLWHRCFPVNLRTPFLQNTCGRLPLIM